MVNGVANYSQLRDSLGHEKHFLHGLQIFTVVLINKTKLPNACHTLRNSVAMKGLIN